jgi:hypothetical protein
MIWGPFVWAFMWSHSQPPVETKRCTVRVSATAVYVDGNIAMPTQVVALCKRTEGAVVAVAEDAPAASWSSLRSQLERAGIKIYMRGVIDDHVICATNPLARGCNVIVPKTCVDNPLANGCH